MGYTTEFTGRFNLDKPLTVEHSAYLKQFSGTRRMLNGEVEWSGEEPGDNVVLALQGTIMYGE